MLSLRLSRNNRWYLTHMMHVSKYIVSEGSKISCCGLSLGFALYIEWKLVHTVNNKTMPYALNLLSSGCLFFKPSFESHDPLLRISCVFLNTNVTDIYWRMLLFLCHSISCELVLNIANAKLPMDTVWKFHVGGLLMFWSYLGQKEY